MDITGKRIILASGSPRRRELLSGLDIEFEVDTLNYFEEHYSPDTPHELIPVQMSEGKSFGFHRDLEQGEILITSDTMVLCGSRVLGKPAGTDDTEKAADAAEMLRLLSGRTHEVVTAVTIRDCRRHETFSDTASVTFNNLSDEEIRYYVEKYRPFDKAGAYGIQEWIGYVGIRSIQGSFYTVMGLPVHLVYRKLMEFCR